MQAAAAKQAQSDLTDICDPVAEIKKEFRVSNFDKLKTLLKEVLEKNKSCTSVQEKLFAFIGAMEAFKPNTVPPHGSQA